MPCRFALLERRLPVLRRVELEVVVRGVVVVGDAVIGSVLENSTLYTGRNTWEVVSTPSIRSTR
jgi:hypothetical protein